MHPTGFPAYVVSGWLASVALAPLGEPAFRANLYSALLAALAVALLVGILRRLAVPLPIAVAGAVGFALTPITWSIASAADVHALHIVLVALVVLALVRWAGLVDARRGSPDDRAAASRADRGIVLAAAIFGVAVANHGLTYLLVPAVGLYVLAVDRGVLHRPRLVAAAVGACLGVAALLYLELPLRAGPFPAPIVYGTPDTWQGFWDIVLARQFQGDLQASGLGERAADLARLAVAQLGVLVVLLPPALLVTAVRFPRYALLSGTATLVTCAFAGLYQNANIGRYYLGPALFAWSWLAIAAGVLVNGLFARARAGQPAGEVDEPGDPGALGDEGAPGGGRPVLRPRSRRAASRCAPPSRSRSPWPSSIPTGLALAPRWHAVDRSQDTVFATWLDDALTHLDRDAVVVSWWSASTTLWYGTLVEGRRPDLLVIDDSDIVTDDLGSVEAVIDTYLGRRPVYVIRSTAADLDALAVRYVLEPVDVPPGIYLVTGTQETQP